MCDGVGNCRIKQDRAYRRMHEAAAAGFACVVALAIAELSKTGAIAACTRQLPRIRMCGGDAKSRIKHDRGYAACTSCLLCRGLFSFGTMVLVHDNDARVQQRCSVGRMMCAQLPLD
jgi:hypothetical protein